MEFEHKGGTSCDPGTDEGGERAGWDSPEGSAGGQAHSSVWVLPLHLSLS